MIFSAGMVRDHLFVCFPPLPFLSLFPPPSDSPFPLSSPIHFTHQLRSQTNRYHLALLDQPHSAILPKPYATYVPAALFIIGQTLVVSSTWALGITGTFLGDYFGILMDSRVEGCVSSIFLRKRERTDDGGVGSLSMFLETQCTWVARCVSLLVPCGKPCPFFYTKKFTRPN